MTTIKEYLRIKNLRGSITRKNAGLRMSGKSHLQEPLPELPPKPSKFLIEDEDGNYIGCETDGDFAKDYAKDHGYIVTELPFDAKL